MKTLRYAAVFVMLVLAACGPQASPEPIVEVPTESPLPATNTPSPTAETPTDTAPPPTEAIEPGEFAGLPLPTDRGDLFAASGACAVCHSQMADEAGNDVSIDTDWRTSMMANAARDPYWLASVRSEILSSPDYRAVIEDKCATCHMPIARTSAVAEGDQGEVLDTGFTDPNHAYHVLAVDGVSCTLCHQIKADGFGEDESFSGGYAIDTTTPTGERETYGPHPVGEGLAQIMQSASGYIPIQSPHVEESELCATCHTLYTPYLDASGKIAGEFPEQMVYSEWLASSFADSASCQQCHMPAAEGGVQLSITGGPLRSPFHQHTSLGGNVFMVEILSIFGEEMAVTASSAQFQEKQAEILEQMENHAASISLQEVDVEGTTLTANVTIATMAGHKTPTSFPSRRAWIHLVVKDGSGQVVFESGATNPDGSIVGNDNDDDPAAYEPHFLTIDSPGQVQIYESIMGNSEGQVTTTLLRGASYLKDNRLLPSGFDKAAVDPDIGVYGAALADEDFTAGGDSTQYIVELGDAQGPFTVTAELLYQSIGYRWADNLRRYDAPEPARFIGYYDQVPNRPVVVATASAELGE